MSARGLAKRIEARSWKLKDKLIDMRNQAKDAGLHNLSEELAGAFLQMDEVIGAASAAATDNKPLQRAQPSQ
jgi:hypothetical protein